MMVLPGLRDGFIHQTVEFNQAPYAECFGETVAPFGKHKILPEVCARMDSDVKTPATTGEVYNGLLGIALPFETPSI